MPRYLLFVLLTIAACLHTHAQQVELMFTAGMGSYSMGDMKKLNSGLHAQVPFETKVTTNFPMTLQLGGNFAVQLSKIYKMGIKYAYNSTGSRVAASDYSGSYRFDNVISGHTLGMINSFLLYDHKAFRVDIQTNIGIVASILKINEELHVVDTTLSSSVHYSSVGVFFEPMTEATYQWKYLKAGIFFGYFVNAGGRIKNEKGERSNSTINWSGFRFGIEIGIHQINR